MQFSIYKNYKKCGLKCSGWVNNNFSPKLRRTHDVSLLGYTLSLRELVCHATKNSWQDNDSSFESLAIKLLYYKLRLNQQYRSALLNLINRTGTTSTAIKFKRINTTSITSVYKSLIKLV